jgi:hypothetical protein
MKSKVYYPLLIFIGFIFFISCSGGRRPPPQKVINALEREFGPPVPTSVTPNITNSKIEIYLDGSGSVNGFVRKEKPEAKSKKKSYETGTTCYCQFLKSLDAYLKGKQASFQYLKFGTYIEQVTKCDNAMDVWFYDQEHTKLGQLIESFSQRSMENLPIVFLVFTDGLQSTPDQQDFRKVVEGVSKWLSKGFYFEILAFRSEFNGDVFCETEGGIKVGWYNSNDYGLRPIFCYIFSLKRGFGKELAQALQATYATSCTVIDFSIKLFEPSKTDFKISNRTSRGTENFLRSRATERGVKYFYWKGGYAEQLSGEFLAKINLRLTKEGQDFQITPYGIKTTVQCLDIENSIELQSAQIIPCEIKAFPKDKPSRLEIRYTVEGANHTPWVGYRFTVLPGEGTIQPPKWVDDWSTHSDHTLADFTKTLYFSEFIRSIMLRTRFIEQPLAVFYIAIKGR